MRGRHWMYLGLIALLPLAAFADDSPAPDRAAIVERISEALSEVYIFPDVAEKMNAHLRQRLADGTYDELDINALSQQLTEDLQEISHDLHLSVRPIPPRDINAEQEINEAKMRARYLENIRRGNYGFREIKILPGNVGYLDLRGFVGAETGGATAIAAMNFLASADALIVDLRKNGGGSPSMIQLLSSYFFDEPQHLNSFYIRREDTTHQFWTQAHVEGEKMVDTPIWVLTSGRTFSAAEEFTYNLKNMERATIVGQTTGGGAHPVDSHHFPELGVRMSLPFGRAINPITGTNWEGTGIKPHHEVPAAEALTVAHRQALEKLVAEAEDEDHKAALDWVLTGMASKEKPIVLTPEALQAYVGVYGPRTVTLEGGVLRYQRGQRPPTALYPIAEDFFGLEVVDNFRARFERDGSGRVVTLVGVYQSGREEATARTGDLP